MNQDDYAIVVGIGQYPTLAPPHPPGTPHDLDGSVIDAREVDAWLADEQGGGVPEENRILVTTEDFVPFDRRTFAGQERVLAEPNALTLAGCFGWLNDRHNASTRLKLGRRLYVYFSGHGFGVRDCDGGVIAADASSILHHFYVSSWFDWFYRNAVFEEFVLWVDACSDPMIMSGAPSEAPLAKREVANFSNGRRFVVFAAPHPLRSVERRMPDGRVRGVFTYALLNGLRGAAADRATGRVTSETLRDYLRANLSSFQPEQDRTNPQVGNEPAFGTVDPIDFGTPGVQTFPRAIHFAERHKGKRAEILDGQFKPLINTIADDDAPWTVDLASGLYKLEIQPDIAEVIEVNGDRARDIHIA